MEKHGDLLLHHASVRLARKRMELSLQRAIERFNARRTWEVYSGQAWHFRWGRDHELYHWQEFEEFYGDWSKSEWQRAHKLMCKDASFIIPQFFMQEIVNDICL